MSLPVEGGRLVTVRNGRRREYEIGRLKDVRVDMHEDSCHFFRLQPSAGKPVVVEPIGDAAGAVEELEAQCRQRGVPFHRKEHTLHPRGVISYGLLPLAFNIVAIVLFRVFVPGGFGSWMG